MQARAKSSANQPLKGIRVLVGRARHQASALSRELRQKGAAVLDVPFIEIRQPRSFRPLDGALKNLATYDWLILTSVNGVEAMWDRLEKVWGVRFAAGTRKSLEHNQFRRHHDREGHDFSRAAKGTKAKAALAAEGGRLKIAAIGPATKNSLEQRGLKVGIVPKQYVAESVVRSLKNKVKGKRVLLIRAKVARDVIPRELRRAGAHVDVVEAYETVIPQRSRRRLHSVLQNRKTRPHVITFTSSSTARNFVDLLGPHPTNLDGIRLASIGPVTSATLRELSLHVDIQAKEFTIPGLVDAIVRAFTR